LRTTRNPPCVCVTSQTSFETNAMLHGCSMPRDDGDADPHVFGRRILDGAIRHRGDWHLGRDGYAVRERHVLLSGAEIRCAKRERGDARARQRPCELRLQLA